MKHLQVIEEALHPLMEPLRNHSVYEKLSTMEDVRCLMEYHVFAVWDFMSLLKALQREITCVEVPWIPVHNAKLARFINEIVIGEETDTNFFGEPQSHFEMYLEAMEQVGASRHTIDAFIQHLSSGLSWKEALLAVDVSQSVRDFVSFTFSVIERGQAHEIAAAFTYGREDLIPDMFLAILKQVDAQNEKYFKLRYYLERHIELDGDEHGPLAMQLVLELCGEDETKWLQVQQTAEEAVHQRIKLWDSVEMALTQGRR